MKRILVTGFSGFVGRHFLNELLAEETDCQVLGIDIRPPQFPLPQEGGVRASFAATNLLDAKALEEILADFRPDAVLHLAAFSSVAYSWEHPSESFQNNTGIFLNLCEGIRRLGLQCRILSVGSSEVYGEVRPEDLPLSEQRAITPQNPYAAARISQEHLSRLFVEHYGMDIVLTRSFNHIGPGQDTRFVVPGFIRRILDLKDQGKTAGEITTGDLTVIRDFTDVRDVVKAYRLLLLQGMPGEVYNICSGQGVQLSEVVSEIARQTGMTVTCRTDPAFVRPKENRRVIGSYEKIEKYCGFAPQIPFSQTIADMIADMEQ